MPPNVGAGTNATRYSYNLDGQVTSVIRPDGAVIEFTYDGAGRLETITLPRGTISHTYHPDTGDLSALAAPDGGLSFTYDGSLLTESAWEGLVNGSVSCTYDSNYRVSSRSVNGARTIAFVYDDDGLLTQAGSLALSRDAQNGAVSGSTLGNVTDTSTHNGFGEVEEYSAAYSGSDFFTAQYTRDKLGRITEMSEAVDGHTKTYAYSYDAAGRLTEVRKNDATVGSYTYDSNGNRLSYTGPAGLVSGSYDDQDRLFQYGQQTYAYSASGELQNKTDTVSDETTIYQYDVFGNLIGVTLPDGTQIEYVIDGVNRRIGKKVNGGLVQGLLYKDLLKPIAELDVSGEVVSLFIYASETNVPDYMEKGGSVYQIISDHLGSARLVMDTATGETVQKIEYDEFGNILSDTNPGFQPFGYAGGIYDPHTKLTRFGARDYDAETGRWTAKDPIRFFGPDTNLFAYVLNDPVNRVDTTGTACGSAVTQWYLGQLREIIRLRAQRAGTERSTRALEAMAGMRRLTREESTLEFITGFLEHTGGHEVGMEGQGAVQRLREQREAREMVHEARERLGEIARQISQIEEDLRQARQACPCLYRTDFP